MIRVFLLLIFLSLTSMNGIVYSNLDSAKADLSRVNVALMDNNRGEPFTAITKHTSVSMWFIQVDDSGRIENLLNKTAEAITDDWFPIDTKKRP